MGLAASDNLHQQAFLVQVENYRRDFIKALNDHHAYGGSKTGEWSWKAGKDFYKSVADYEYEPVRLAAVLPNYFIDLLLLTLWAFGVSILVSFGSRKMKIK